jgi:hypothetical protein
MMDGSIFGFSSPSTENDQFGFDPPASYLPYPQYIAPRSVPILHNPGVQSIFDDFLPRQNCKIHLQEDTMSVRITWSSTPASNQLSSKWPVLFPQKSPTPMQPEQVNPPCSLTLPLKAVAPPSVEQYLEIAAFTCPRPQTKSKAQATTVPGPSKSPPAKRKYRRRQASIKPTEPEPEPAPTRQHSKRVFPLKENQPEARTSKRKPLPVLPDSKRKLSLEKNRLAAARCRVNKKQRTDHLQESWRELICKNGLLRTTVSDMIEDIRLLQSCLVHHSTTGGCEMPAEIDRTLQRMRCEHLWSKLRVGEDNDMEMMEEEYTSVPRSEQKESRAVPVPDGYFQSFPSLEVLSFNEAEPLPQLEILEAFETATDVAGLETEGVLSSLLRQDGVDLHEEHVGESNVS